MASRTRTLSAIATATLLFGACAAFGCAGKSANSTPPASAASVPAADDDAMAGLMEHHRYHHHAGVTLFIAMSLDTLGVSPEQRVAVEKIRTDLQSGMQPAVAADQNLISTLAGGLDSSNLEPAKVDAAVAQVVAASAAVRAATADALNQLHAVLTPPQRAALVDKVESHWAVWQRSNAEEQKEATADEGHLAVLTADLSLTPDQVAKTRASLDSNMKAVPRVDSQQVTLHLKAFGDAFQSDHFDAKTYGTMTSDGDVTDARLAGWGAAYLAHFIEAVSPSLDPEQRSKLAQRLRDHAAHNPSAQANP
ncbi:MAG TPA: Spy/CpxP family protein refolding chaperone [Polyangiaceae bacterium]|jgi:Spy/CpxP family protein refolding chaperone|nr:Spy/CpxP family protein refolding chaperone [Polyangiaceae bacterium]